MFLEVNVGGFGVGECMSNRRRTEVSDGVGALGSGEGETRTMARVVIHRALLGISLG